MNYKLWLAQRAVVVGGHVVTERVRRPVPRTRDDIPRRRRAPLHRVAHRRPVPRRTRRRTLLHGDSHVGQTYVTSGGRMGLTDWQATLQGGWAWDFAYFLGSACEPEDRRAWERELLETYLGALADAGGEAPGFDEAWLAYRQQLFYPYSAWAFTIGRAWYQPRMQPEDICLAIIKRLSTAIDDLDSFGALGI